MLKIFIITTKIFIKTIKIFVVKRLNFEFNLIENVETLRKFLQMKLI